MGKRHFSKYQQVVADQDEQYQEDYVALTGKSEDFLVVLVNRPLLILHSDAGYVGLTSDMKRLEGNCSDYVLSTLSLSEDGYYNFQIG